MQIVMEKDFSKVVADESIIIAKNALEKNGFNVRKFRQMIGDQC